MFRNIIFDWSGTLCDDLGPVVETVDEVLRHYGAEPVGRERFLEDFKLPFGDFYRDRLPGVSHDELEATYQRYYPESRAGVEAIPHAVEFVGSMRASGRRCFILSAVTPGHFHRQADELGLAGAFDGIYLGVRDKREVLPDLLRSERLEATETCFIGDMVHDVEAAHVAGIAAISVLTGYDSAAKLAGAAPHLLIPDLSRLAWWFALAEERTVQGSAESTW